MPHQLKLVEMLSMNRLGKTDSMNQGLRGKKKNNNNKNRQKHGKHFISEAHSGHY